MENTYFNKTSLQRVTWKWLDGSGTITSSMKRIFQIKEYRFEVYEDPMSIEIIRNDRPFAVIFTGFDVLGNVEEEKSKDFFSDRAMLELAVAFIEHHERYGAHYSCLIGIRKDNGYLKVGDYFLTDCDPHFDEDYDDTEYGEIR